jgi:hypothetical protein
MCSVRDGVLLIDEVDSGLHHGVIDSLWDYGHPAFQPLISFLREPAGADAASAPE